MSAPEPSLMSEISGWIASAAAGLATIVWGDMKLRVGKVEAGLSMKADKDEMDRQRNNVDNLFEKVESHARRSEERFTEVIDLMHKLHRETSDKLDKKQDKRR